MDEFGLIKRYFSSLSENRQDVLKGIGDDCALLKVPPNQALAVSTDSLVLEQHFLKDWDPFVIGYKALACNLSDLAAMGAEPAWVSLALTLPTIDEQWLKGFSNGFNSLLEAHEVSLIGGDITKGPLQITVTIHGFVDPEKALCRDGAKTGDHIYVTGSLGEPAFAVSQLKTRAYQDDLFKKLFYPEPRIAHGLVLRDFATSAIDISDGLCADLGHILSASQKSAELKQLSIPSALSHLDEKEAFQYALTGGDEYELCFTVSPENISGMESTLHQKELSFYCIGCIHDGKGLVVHDKHDNKIDMSLFHGFKHF